MERLDEIFDWYGKLERGSVEKIRDYYAEEAFFKDPFNEVKGRDKIKHIFDDMFNQLENPRFVFIDKIEQDHQAFVTWDFKFAVKQKAYTIHGSSHLKLNEQKMIIYHRDYWDVGEELLLKVPFVKNIYGAFRKKVSSS